MRSSVDALERDISEMKAMASAIKPAIDILAQSTNPDLKTYLSVRRRFEYAALIVILYASFERFVEDILIQWEFPRLCRGGSRSLTFQGVVSGHPLMKLRFVSRQSTRTMEFHQWTSSRA